ncbi:MAG: GH92 family glycosyl hydrolase [Verrucomicrobiia bacterium]
MTELVADLVRKLKDPGVLLRAAHPTPPRRLWSCLLGLALWLAVSGAAESSTATNLLWQIGQADNSASEFALAPAGYGRFLEQDFGWEDRYFLIGHSKAENDWPYVLPGPSDTWGGTSGTAGRRTHFLTILFGLKQPFPSGDWKLVVDLLDTHPQNPPSLKIVVNGHATNFALPRGGTDGSIRGREIASAREHIIEVPLPAGRIRAGGNEICLTTLDGSWLVFDQIRLEGPGGADLAPVGGVFLRSVHPAEYAIMDEGTHAQPLLVDVEHLAGTPQISVRLDGTPIFSESVEQGRHTFEAPMPAVSAPTTSRYEILVDGTTTETGQVLRSPQRTITPAEYVDTRIGTAHSRWMIAPGPWMPFSMVKLSPDTQNAGWQAGYEPSLENIAGFSHIHEWTMAGVSLMPTAGPLEIHEGSENDPDSGYRSRLDKSTEQAPIGYYSADLTDYGIRAELTSTTRCGFHRYTFPKDKDSRVLVDLQFGSEYLLDIQRVEIRKVSGHRIEGLSTYQSECWGKDGVQDYTVHFVIEFDRPIKAFGVWCDGKIEPNASRLQTQAVGDAGAYAEFDTREHPVVQARVGISLVSIENAALNLRTEVTDRFGWDFEAIRTQHVKAWNDLLGRIQIHTPDRREKVRFYNNLYRAFCRNTWSDVNGQWVDATEQVRQLPDGDLALGCDAFWNTFWNLNQLWNLVAPEWSSLWVRSQLAMYHSLGWLAKGPAGMEYIPVMVAEHEIPLMVGAYQMGIRDFDAEQAFAAVRKMQTTPAKRIGGGLAGNRDLEAYLEHKYVPYDKGRFSNSLEYSYDDWAVAQFALALGKNDDYQKFLERSTWWRNTIDQETGYARLRDSAGVFLDPFDFYKSGANEQYVEGNAWQLTFFVPQDVPGLAKAIGVDRFRQRLEWGFAESYKWRFNAPNDQYWDYPVIQGNQQSMHFAFLFNWVQRPWLTQKWSRAIIERYYGNGLANAYLGDEDQGQMSAWFVMAAIGLFQTDGGCQVNPIYEIASPLYRKIILDLGLRYGRGKTFTIDARNVSRNKPYIQSATLNGKKLDTFCFPASELLKGGELVLQMGPEPNRDWGSDTTVYTPARD